MANKLFELEADITTDKINCSLANEAFSRFREGALSAKGARAIIMHPENLSEAHD